MKFSLKPVSLPGTEAPPKFRISGPAYNPAMLQSWSKLLAPAAQDRITLLLNHVISREPAAMARLAPLAGKTVLIHLAGWPAVLPAAPDLRLRITPAGLWERLEADDSAQQDPDPARGESSPVNLRIGLDASNPAAAALAVLGGQRPQCLQL